MTLRIIEGDCRDVMATMDAASVDAVVTDPPYDLTANKKGGSGLASLNLAHPAGRSRITTGGGFMGKEWDGTGVAFDPATWEAVKRVLTPGGYLLAFGGTRTHHRMMCAIEDAGFVLVDCLMWVFGSGFPKHKSLLKPAYEPIVLAKKPGKGVLNIDGCRIGRSGVHRFDGDAPPGVPGVALSGSVDGSLNGCRSPAVEGMGRWPANVVLDEVAAEMLDGQSGESASVQRIGPRTGKAAENPGGFAGQATALMGHTDTGGASRFFYTAKASRAERNKGLDGLAPRLTHRYSPKGQGPLPQQTPSTGTVEGNHHPCVKPLDLMQWLIRLVTPAGGTVLDPFAGSGSTLIAADREGFDAIGIEREAEYVSIARARITGDAPLFARIED